MVIIDCFSKFKEAALTVTFRTIRPSDDDQCAICLESPKYDKNWKAHKVSVGGGPDHKFHTRCISNWFNIQSNCPTCRAKAAIEYSFCQKTLMLLKDMYNNKGKITIAIALTVGSIYLYNQNKYSNIVISCLHAQNEFFAQRLKEFPKSIANCSEYLPYLSLTDHLFESIPEWIGNFVNLRELILVGNRLSFVPDAISGCKNLELLNLRENMLKSLSKSLGDLQKLKRLNLDDNQFSSIPEAVRSLRNLEVLSLSNNKIEEIPEWICELPKLQQLYLGKNQLFSIPRTLMNCKKLKVLALYKNPISEFPGWLRKMEISQLLLGQYPKFSD